MLAPPAQQLDDVQNLYTGPALVVYWQAIAPKASIALLQNSAEPFDRWLLKSMAAVHSLPMSTLAATISANEMVGEYPRVR